MTVELTLLGPPQLSVDGATPTLGAKPMALLAFLAVEQGPHARDELAALLWSDSPTSAARASLRQALRQARTAVGPLLACDRRTVTLAPAVDCDLQRFLAAIPADPETAAHYDVTRFLAGFELRHASGFEEWVEQTRERLLAESHRTLRAATRRAMSASRWRRAVEWSERWVASDPLSDEATRLLVESLYMAGDRGEALARYEAHRTRLAEDAGAVESTALRDLARRIAEDPTPGARTAAREPEHDLPRQSFEPALAGREREWQALLRAWDDARTGAGRVVLVEGEAGLGKTRLAEDFLQWVNARGGTVLRGRGFDAAGGIPYGPIVELLQDALRAPGLPGVAPEWLAEAARIAPEVSLRFPGLPTPSAPGDTDRRWRLFESVAQIVTVLAAERPAVVFVDDLQRCDEASCALLHFLARRLEQTAALLVTTITLGEEDRAAPASRLCRAIRVGDQATLVLTLGPLSEAQVWQMIRELGRISAPDGARRFARQIHTATDGNPFHVLEVLKALFAQGMLTTDPDTGEWLTAGDVDTDYQRLQLPRTIRDAVAARYRRLPYELRDLLATVATAGLNVSTALLSHVHGVSRLRAAALADALVERRLLTGEEGRYRCAHPIILDVVRTDLTAARRQELHRAIAHALVVVQEQGEDVSSPGEIARHAERGDQHALACRQALLASDAAVGRRAYDEALMWLDLAARTAPGEAETATVNARTAAILDAAGWSEPPRRRRRTAETPARGILRTDLDLRLQQHAPVAPPQA